MKKYPIIKAGFHIIVMVVLVIPPNFFFGQGPHEIKLFDENFFSRFLIIPAYCINVFWLVPHLLQKRKYLIYIIIGITISVTFSRLASYLRKDVGPPQREISHTEGTSPTDFPLPDRGPGKGLPSFHFFPYIMALAIGTSFEMIIDWEKQRRKQEEIQKERKIAELSFLKSQINPHFLFNTINNIYSLAAAKSERTEEAILLLSEMMRYVLYESNVEKISLLKEILFIENFIALQKLRLSVTKKIDIDFSYSGNIENVMVEPMLFLPFVENAFKHGISYKKDSFINVKLKVEQNVLEFSVANSMPETAPEPAQPKDKQDSGIGLLNTYKRLNLLYPDKHELLVSKSESRYEVLLHINLS